MQKLKLKNSLDLWKKAQKLIPSGTQLLSKGPQAHVLGAYPVFIEKGLGSRVWDVDGNEYLDFTMGFGPMILGYQHFQVKQAVIEQLDRWSSFTLINPDTVKLAETLCEIIPCAEMVRFGKHGSDATTMAVKCARAYTGREKVAMWQYHGWHDWSVVVSALTTGIPKVLKDYTLRFEYNNLSSLEKIFRQHPEEIAAVIMEPVEFEKPEPGFLRGVKDLARHYGALLIFDEVVTGFRFDLGGAQQFFEVTPDLACFGKALANGFPLSALVGQRKYMEVFDYNRVFFSSTFGDEAFSIAAAIATIEELRKKPVKGHLWDLGAKLRNVYDYLANLYGLPTKLIGYPCFMTPYFSVKDERQELILKSLLLQETAKRGVLFGRYQYISWAHRAEDIVMAGQALEEAFKVLAIALESGQPEKYLEGQMIEPVRA